mgnify:FL=1
MFVRISGARFRVLQQDAGGAWVIAYDEYQMPVYINRDELERAERIAAPEEYVRNRERPMSAAQQQRYDLLRPALEDDRCITDEAHRTEVFAAIARENNTTARRLRRLYHAYLARGSLTRSKPRESVRKPDYEAAIRKYYFSAKRNSLRTAYELYILENYTNKGVLADEIPSWSSFRLYYFRHFRGDPQREIAREGLTAYQRNNRPLYGSAMQYRESVGCYQVDETQGDIYLVSKWDRSKVIGRPNVYLAIDTASGLIAGVYVGLDAGETALMACIANAAGDKATYCAAYGIDLSPDDWPSRGLPSEIISDRGGEFVGDRINELCICYGIDRQALPPFRAEEKPLVERAMDLIQDSYKSMLRGRGVIGDDVGERWATDYRKQAILTLDEYTAIVIHTIIALNKGRVLTDIGHLPVDAPNTPAQLWKWLIDRGKSTLLDVDADELYRRALPRASGKITRKGIVWNGLRYLPERGAELTVGQKVEYAYDAQDTSHIYVVGKDKRLIPCSLAPSSSRYDGYDMADVAVMRREEAEKEKAARQTELEARVAMRSEIEKIIRLAEEQSPGSRDISEIQRHRTNERRRLT